MITTDTRFLTSAAFPARDIPFLCLEPANDLPRREAGRPARPFSLAKRSIYFKPPRVQ